MLLYINRNRVGHHTSGNLTVKRVLKMSTDLYTRIYPEPEQYNYCRFSIENRAWTVSHVFLLLLQTCVSFLQTGLNILITQIITILYYYWRSYARVKR